MNDNAIRRAEPVTRLNPRPQVLPRDHFLASEPNNVRVLVWSVIGYFVARKFKWIK
jgi:hypothetical protein